MCWFISIGVPVSDRQKFERVSAEHHGLHFSALREAVELGPFPNAHVSSEVTFGGCSCSIFQRHNVDVDAEVLKRELQLKRKGWSHAKVKRALDDMGTSLTRPRTPEPEQERFAAFVESLLVAGCGQILLFAQFHGSKSEAGVAGISGRASINLHQLKQLGFRADTLVSVRMES